MIARWTSFIYSPSTNWEYVFEVTYATDSPEFLHVSPSALQLSLTRPPHSSPPLSFRRTDASPRAISIVGALFCHRPKASLKTARRQKAAAAVVTHTCAEPACQVRESIVVVCGGAGVPCSCAWVSLIRREAGTATGIGGQRDRIICFKGTHRRYLRTYKPRPWGAARARVAAV